MERTRRRGKRRGPCGAGYTIIELVLVMALAGTLVVYAMVNITHTLENYDLSSATMEVLGYLRFAQQQAHAHNGWYGVRFDVSPADQVTVYTTDGSTDTAVTDPLNPAASLIADLSSRYNVSIVGVNIGGGAKVEFSPLGIPYGDKSGSALANDGTVTLVSGAGTRIVKVLRNTGRAELQ